MLEGIKVAHEAIKAQCQLQLDIAEAVGASEKREFEHEPSDEELEARIEKHCYDACYEIAKKRDC